MHNLDIKEAIRKAGLKFWQVADRLGLNDGNFSRKLRKELPEEEKAKIRAIITELSNQQEVK